MIRFYYKEKIVCSMPLEGLTVPQMLAGWALTAQRLKVSKNCIDYKYAEEV